MSDLIERLRDKARLRAAHGLTGWVLAEEALLAQAADEIERLTAERDELRRQLAEAWAEREAMANVLPGYYYMDPPDGGDVSVLEQLRRMAKDAERYRWLRPRFFAADFAYSDPPVCAIVFRWPESAKISANLDREIDAAMGASNE